MSRKPDLPCADCGKLLWRSGTSLPEGQARCRPCRVENPTLTHGASGYKRGCRCVVCTDGARLRLLNYRKAYKTRTGKSYRPPSREPKGRICFDCDKPLTGSAMSDTPRCMDCWLSHESIRARAITRRKRAIQKLRKAAIGKAANPRWPFVQGVCASCLEPFARRGQPSRYCSSKCRRYDQPQKWITRSARLAIYERDLWMCQICSEPVDRDAHYLDGWSATLDHIIPRSLGGTNEPDQLRLAHRWCNSVRGNLTYYTDVDLAA